MNNITTFYKKSNFLLAYSLVFLLLISPPLLLGNDGLPHNFNAGDVISADVLNEMFERVAPGAGKLSEIIIGTWTAKNWDTQLVDLDVPAEGTLTVNSLTDITYQGNVTLAGLLSNGETIPGVTSPSTISRISSVGNSALLVDLEWGIDEGQIYTHHVLHLTPNRIIISNIYNGVTALTRINTSPSRPSGLSADVDGLAVTLVWTDNSDDETGFNILRKGNIKGSFSVITTTGADAITYEDTVPEAGRYWYRIKATNANGDSIGSKVVKVIVTEE